MERAQAGGPRTHGARRLFAVTVAVLALAALAGAAPPSARALISTGDGTWHWQTPQPTGNSILDVSFADAAEVWAVGTAGAILHSVDGGVTWAAQRSGTTQDLNGVSFTSAQLGWAVGNGIFHTVDGGATWTRSAPPGSENLAGISFLDALHGWAWGANNVLRTSDGGATWQLATLASDVYLSTGSFVGDGIGVVGTQSGAVYGTGDGGATWNLLCVLFAKGQRPGDDPNLVSLSLADGLVGLATVQDGRAARAQILRTVDGGQHWRTVVALSDSGWIGVRFTGAGEAWAAGSQNSGTVSRIFHSTDGGLTWSRRTVGRTNVWMAAARGDSVCAFGSEILTSGDGGGTWAKRTSGAEDFATTIAMADATHGWAAGGRWGGPIIGSGRFASDSAALILHTTDGVSWTEQFTDSAAGGFVKIVCSDTQNAWALDQNNTLWHTGDGGAHWAKQVSGPPSMTNDVSFPTAQDGWMVYPGAGAWGFGGGLMHTTDGGKTWSRGHVTAEYQLHAVSFVDVQHGWLCGGDSGSSILRTTDGGGSWSEVTLLGYDLESIRFFDDQHGWAWGWDAQGDNVMMRSDDGGRTWTPVADLAGIGVENLDFCDADNGWAIGYQGIYRSADGGAHWALTDSGANDMYDVAAVDVSHVWAAGQGIVGTVDTGADTAAPATLDDADGAWRNTPTVVTLNAADIGGSGLAGTQYRLAGQARWHALVAGAVAFPAHRDHSGDGLHTLVYRSSDNAGNVEAPQYCQVAIDTRRPTPLASWASRAVHGKTASLAYSVRDVRPGSPTASVVIRVRDGHGRLVETFRVAAASVDKRHAYRFTCHLPRGTYRFTVSAVDAAGNKGTEVAGNVLVVR